MIILSTTLLIEFLASNDNHAMWCVLQAWSFVLYHYESGVWEPFSSGLIH